MRFALAAFFVFVGAVEARAGIRADSMADFCDAIATNPATDGLRRTYDNGVCRGLFFVVEDIVDFGDVTIAIRPVVRVCRPKDWMDGWGDRTGQDVLIAMFVRHVASLPTKRRQEAFLPIAIESLEQAFPCSAQQRTK